MLAIDVISDVICPWCYIGKRRLEKALAAQASPFAVKWHPFELNPDMPAEGVDRKAYRIEKFGSWERSQELDEQIVAAGRAEGLNFRFDNQSRTPNTFDAHRIIWLAGEVGVQDSVVEAIFRAYFTEGRDLCDRATLVTTVVEAGLDRTLVNELLAGVAGRDPVRAGEAKARELGVSGVPFFLLNGQVALSGAQPPEVFLGAFAEVSPPAAISRP